MMPDEQFFRFVMLATCAVAFPVARYYRLKAWSARDRLDRSAEGRFILWTLRPIAAIGMIGLAAFLIRPEWMAWSSVQLPSWLRAAGVAVGVVAAALRIAVFRTLGTNLTDTVATRLRHTLVTTGPYRWVRHPFYVAVALAVLANSVGAANWFLGLTGVATIALFILRTRIEEAKLVERFGVEYVNYMERTGRFFPRFSGSPRDTVRCPTS